MVTEETPSDRVGGRARSAQVPTGSPAGASLRLLFVSCRVHVNGSIHKGGFPSIMVEFQHEWNQVWPVNPGQSLQAFKR